MVTTDRGLAGSLNANLMSGPRVGFAMARDGVFPLALAKVRGKLSASKEADYLEKHATVEKRIEELKNL